MRYADHGEEWLHAARDTDRPGGARGTVRRGGRGLRWLRWRPPQTAAAGARAGAEGASAGGAELRAPAEHRLRAHRRPGLESRPLHARGSAVALTRCDLQPVLRNRLALLSLAGVDLHGPAPARHGHLQQYPA